MNLINRILVFIDDSDASIAAIQYAVLLAKKMDAELYGLFVVNTKALNDLVKAHIFVVSEQAEYQEELQADADRYLRLATKLANSKNVAIVTEKKEGSPPSEIRKFVAENKIDLLVVGTDDDGRMKSLRDEVASNKDLTTRRVDCNVVIVKNIDGVEQIFEKMV